jgi:prolyl oligopeptidase
MSRSIPALRTICAALAGACALAQAAPAASAPAVASAGPAASSNAPAAPVRPVTDTYHGVTVTDGYRYMEDLSAPDVRAWAKAQDDATRAALDAIPGRAKLLARIGELEASDAARTREIKLSAHDRVFYEKRRANENQQKLYVRDGVGGAERLLVDPEALAAASGVPHAIEFYEPSHDGRRLAYGISAGGSEEAVLHVIDVATGKELVTPITRAHYGYANWLPDDSGFVYLRQRELPAGAPATDKYKGQSAWLHRFGAKGADVALLTGGTDDHLKIAAAEFPVVRPLAGTPWAVAIPVNGVENEFDLYAAPIGKVADPALKWRKVFGRDAEVTGFAVHGDALYVLTHRSASRFKVLQTSMSHPDLEMARVVVAPGREVIDNIVAAKDALYVQSHDGTAGKLYRVAYTKDAQPVPVKMPVAGTFAIVDADVRRPGVLVSVDAWTHDESFWHVGATDDQVADTGLQATGAFGAPAGLEVQEVLVKSYDGLEVPLSIVYPKGMKLDGANPTELYGYGAYGMYVGADDPSYTPRLLAWYELGGVAATCHVRGGGIYGEAWHQAGKQLTKPNTWKDLIACGEYLVKQGFTSPAKMAIDGGSAGGIMVGRALTARPDLWAVAVPEVGVLNTVRAETSANGVPNIPEFGTVQDKEQFNGLLEMDSFHHVEDGVKYPAVLLMHGFNDPRVPVWESMKMAARLQAASTSGKPVLLRLDFDGGHGIGSTRAQRQAQAADRWAFMLWQFGDPRFQPAAR